MGLLASVRASLGANPAQVREAYQKAITLASDLLKETPRDEYLLADVGSMGSRKQEGPPAFWRGRPFGGLPATAGGPR